MFRRRKTARRKAVQDGPPDAEEIADETQSTGKGKPLSMLDRWARDEAMGAPSPSSRGDGQTLQDLAGSEARISRCRDAPGDALGPILVQRTHRERILST